MKKLLIALLAMWIAGAGFSESVLAQTIKRDGAAVASYAQITPGGAANGGFYTFLAFSHPSLSTATSQIGVTVSMEGPATSAFDASTGRSQTFTINSGETHKLFIVGSNHSAINPTTNSGAFSASRDHFIVTTESASPSGNIRVLSTNADPSLEVTSGRYNNLNQISMWGVIYYETGNAGFAMEFIGDMHDSSVMATGNGAGVVDVFTGRGIN